MEINLTIRVQSDFRTDEFGRDIWTVTQIGNLKKCNITMDKLSDRLDCGFSNGATHSFYGETFHKILDELQKELTELVELTKSKNLYFYTKRRIEELSTETEILEDFITKNNVPNDDTECYDIHAWW